jgi:putative nucleotidyltransferase with HDIG domain
MLHTGFGKSDTLFAALQASRPHVGAHSRRVAMYAVRLATQFGLAPEMIESIRVGALLHDVGKMIIPSRILSKPGRLNRREWTELRTHPEIGMELVHRAGFDEDICRIVLHHHERYDGRGYPDGMSLNEIHWTVRIVSVMDSFDALTSPRQYRERLSIAAARAIIAREAGTRFCPWIVSGLLSLPHGLLEPPAETDDGRYVPDGCVAMERATVALATQPWAVSLS